jgi:hypothetical protein
VALAGLRQAQGLLPEAELLNRQAMGIRDQAHAINCVQYLRSLEMLAEICRRTGRENDAQQWDERANRLRKTLQSADVDGNQ